jgi:hypothetical protein
LEILGEADVPPERLAAKLVEIAEKFKELKTAAAAQPGDDAKITALKAEAQKAIQDGELGKADEFLAAIEKIQTEALDRLALNAAQTTAQRRCGLMWRNTPPLGRPCGCAGGPKWRIYPPYRKSYPIELDDGSKFAFDATSLNGDGVKPEHVGGLEFWTKLLQHCERLVGS